MPYAGSDYTLTPDATLYGLAGYEDEIGNDGHVIHKTALVTLDNTWTASSISVLTNHVRVQLTKAGTPAAPLDNTPAICSHFSRLYDNSDTPHFYKSASAVVLTIPKAVLSSYDATGILNWLNTAKPQVLYQLATPTTATVSPAQIIGAADVNVVTSDGASVTVTYTGSGWAAVGSVQRIAIENVQVNKEKGLRIDTILTDGSTSVPVYFNARGTQIGLYRLSDDKQLWGGRLMPGGRVVTVTDAMTDPDGDGSSLFLVQTSDGKTFLSLDMDSYEGVTNEANPSPAGRMSGVKIGAYNAWTWQLSDYADDWYSYVTGRGLFEISAVDGQLVLTGTNGVVLGYIASDYIPDTTNVYNMGDATHGLKKYYGASTSIQSTSDERAKHDFETLDPDMMKRFLIALAPTWYRLNDVPEERAAGFRAQQFLEAMRTAGIPDDYAGFNGKNPDHLCLDYGQIIAPLVSVVQAQQRQIEEQGRQIQALLQRLGAEEDWAR